ncbi:TVP38/TMEM64 family protein [Dethiothermospora halolimnae]|uniref:TVP38/TMEM64 family protein n=1 Tax=Dethiothermospora halolimnae TaxID=3114390 RepID=UPI003CCC17E8
MGFLKNYSKDKLINIKNKDLFHLFITIFSLVLLILLAKYSGLTKYANMNNITELQQWIKDLGIIGQLIYIIINIITTLLMLPVTPIKILGGLAFGPIIGTILICISTTISATLPFLVSRYALRNIVKRKLKDNEYYKKIHRGVENKGWKMIMTTRLIILFPFTLQNYAYGITGINLFTYVITSFIFMIPSNIGVTIFSAIVSHGGSIVIGIIIYVMISALFAVLGVFYSNNNGQNH